MIEPIIIDLDKRRKVELRPNGITLSYLQDYGEAIIKLAEELRKSYTTGDYTKAAVMQARANDIAYMLNFNEIGIQYNFIDLCRKHKQQEEQYGNQELP